MRLLYIHQYFAFPEDSSGTRSYDLSKEFVKKGIDVTVITSGRSPGSDPTQQWSYMERDGIKLWMIDNEYSHMMSIRQRIKSFLRFSHLASKKAVEIDADIVLATSTPLTIAIPGIWKKWRSKIPFVFEIRDVWPEGPIQQGYVKNKFLIWLLRKIEKYIYNRADYLVPLSTGMRDDILTRVDVKNMEVIPNISEIDRFEHYEDCNIDFDFTGKKVVLYAGTLGPVNDIMYVAKLAQRTLPLAPWLCYLIIGNGQQKKDIVKYCVDNDILDKNIFFLDPIRKKDLPSVYSKVTMGSSFVWDYKIKWDNSANKFFDTLAASRPILINYQGWQADVIRVNQCGYVLPYHLTDEDVRDFVEYMSNDSLLKQHGKNARTKAEDYSLPVAVEKYMHVFDEVLKNRKK